MSFEIQTNDPLKILSSTKKVVETAQFVSINPQAIADCQQRLQETKKRSDQTDIADNSNLEDDIQLLFLRNVVNFCFWAEGNLPRWEMEWPRSKFTGGSFG